MWPFKTTKISIVAEGGKRISIDHNQSTNLDLKIEVHGVESVEINGNTEISAARPHGNKEIKIPAGIRSPTGLYWWQRPLGLLALAITATVIAAGILKMLGWK
jgi:hypothetical protein